MFTTIAFAESIDPAGAFANIAGVADDHVRVDGDLIRVPPELPNLLGYAALLNAPVTVSAVRIEAPSLRAIHDVEFNQLEIGLVFTDPPLVHLQPRGVVPLRADESIDVLANSNPAAASNHVVLVWLSDGNLDPIEGPYYSIRATGQNVGAALVWTSSTLTFEDELPVGRYRILGARMVAATGVAARFVFVGGIWRPGFPVAPTNADSDHLAFRSGMLGSWGEFHTNAPPQLEILGPAGGVPDIILDVQPLAA